MCQHYSGKWAGFHLTNGATVEFNNAIIRQAGEVRDEDTAVGLNPFGAAVFANDAQISFTNVTLSENTGPGLHLTSDDVSINNFERVRLSDNALPARIGLSHLNAFGSSPAISGNVENRIAVENGTSANDVVWHNVGVDYRIDGLYEFTAGTVAINPGVSIRAASGSELSFTGTSIIRAIGAPGSRIEMTGLDSLPGQWAGVTVQSDQQNIFDYVLLQHAGSASVVSNDLNQNGALRVYCSEPSPARLSLSHTRFQDSGSWGLFISETNCTVNIGNEVEYFDNALGDSNR